MFWGVDLVSFFFAAIFAFTLQGAGTAKAGKADVGGDSFFRCDWSIAWSIFFVQNLGGWFEHAKPFQDMVKSVEFDWEIDEAIEGSEPGEVKVF